MRRPSVDSIRNSGLGGRTLFSPGKNNIEEKSDGENLDFLVFCYVLSKCWLYHSYLLMSVLFSIEIYKHIECTFTIDITTIVLFLIPIIIVLPISIFY